MNHQSTANPTHGPSIEKVEVMLGTLLRVGVLLSFLVIIVGIVITIMHNPSFLSDPEVTRKIIGAGDGYPSTIGGLFQGLAVLNGRSIIVLGLVLLILTPVFRVVASIIAFFAQRDWLYTVLTTGVLLVLIISFLIGKTE